MKRADVLFLVPDDGASSTPEPAVLALCRGLAGGGCGARCALLGGAGAWSGASLTADPCPVLHFPDDASVVSQMLEPLSCVVAAARDVAVPAWQLARLHRVPLVYLAQGEDSCARNGLDSEQVVDAYLLADHVLAPSEALKARVQRRMPDKPVTVLPLGVDTHLFAPQAPQPAGGKVRVATFLEAASDRGQGVLLDILHGLARFQDRVCLTVFMAPPYDVPPVWHGSADLVCERLPLEPVALAARLRGCDIFLDTSLYEASGAWPLAAMASGAAVVAAAGGDAAQYAQSEANGLLVSHPGQAAGYGDAVMRLVHDRPLLVRLQREARATAERLDAAAAHARYADFFRDSPEGLLAAAGQTPQAVDISALSPATADRLTNCFPLRGGLVAAASGGSRPLKVVPGGTATVECACPRTCLDDVPPGAARRRPRILDCRGWAVDGRKDGSVGTVYLVLRAPGTEIVVPTTRTRRPDVAAHFGSPQYANAGWQVTLVCDASETQSHRISVRVPLQNGAEYCEAPTAGVLCLADLP